MPRFGHTKTGKPVHQYVWDHHKVDTVYQRFNKHVAVRVTRAVGSMTMAYIFALISLVSLPAILTQAFNLHVFPHWLIAAGLIALVAWISSYFLQLVLLSIIMVGGNVSQEAADARAAKTFEDTETVVDRLNLETEGGITVIDAKLNEILEQLRR